MALTDRKMVLVWGRNAEAQLGLGPAVRSPKIFVPTVLLSLSQPSVPRISQIVGGLWHSLALSEDGVMYGWGSHQSGQLGLGPVVNSATHNIKHQPRQIPLNRIARQISAAGSNSACVTHKGYVYVWGLGFSGQIGTGDKENAWVPTLVKPLEEVEAKQVALGANHVLVLLDNGKVFSFGAGLYGRLGANSEDDRSTPQEIKYLSSDGRKVRTVACGDMHSACVCDHMLLPERDVKVCMGCGTKFSFTVRKVHCNNCGGVFCPSCTRNKAILLRFGQDTPQPVCDKCHTIWISRHSTR